MKYINQRLLETLPESRRGTLVHHPDILLFQHKAHEYAEHWQILIESKYLSTNGYEITPISWFYYGTQSLRNLGGLANECQTETVKLTLLKLAYYGYLSGFSQKPLEAMVDYPFDPEFLSLVSKPRNDQTTRALQQLLIKYFVDHAQTIPRNTVFSLNTAFGNSWLQLGRWTEIPALDPQDPQLISDTVQHLSTEPDQSIEYRFINSSRFVSAAVQHYLDRARRDKVEPRVQTLTRQKRAHYCLKMALSLDNECTLTDVPLFLDYYQEQNNWGKAYELISKMSNLSLALEYLLKRFTEEQRRSFVPKDSPLAIKLARYYLENNDAAKATRFVSNVADYDPTAAFSLLVDQAQYEEAGTLFEKGNSHFSKPHAKKLSLYFSKKSKELSELADSCCMAADWTKAKTHSSNSLVAAKIACRLMSNNENEEQVKIQRRLYAQVLIDEDMQLHPYPCDCDLATITEALQLLDEAKPKNKEQQVHYLKVLARGMIRHVDYLTEQIKVPLVYSRSLPTRLAHQKNNGQTFQLIIDRLTHVIDLLKETDSSRLKLLLGKAHFVLADMILYFDLKLEYKHHFKAAIDAVPKNPFYLLRASEQFEEQKQKLRNAAMPLLKARGFTAEDFYHWDEQRWDQEGFTDSPIHNIHDLETKEQTKKPLLRMNTF